MATRKGGGGGVGTSGAANLKTIILGVISIVVGLIMLGIAMDVVSPMVAVNGTVNWTNYPGGQAIITLFPLLMMISLVLFGGVLIWIGYKGEQMDVKSTILTTVVVIVAVILLPIVIGQTDTLLGRVDIDTYTGLSSFLGLIPLLYVLGITFITGMTGFRAVRSKV